MTPRPIKFVGDEKLDKGADYRLDMRNPPLDHSSCWQPPLEHESEIPKLESKNYAIERQES